MSKRRRFYVQEGPREPWHVETLDHCEIMLCAKLIPVDLESARVQSNWGPKKCPDCYLRLRAERQADA